MMNPDSFIYQGISLIAMVFGTVEFLKTVFKLQGTVVTAVSFLTGMLYMVGFQLLALLPEPYDSIFATVYLSVAFGLTASGIYKFYSVRLPRIDQQSLPREGRRL